MISNITYDFYGFFVRFYVVRWVNFPSKSITVNYCNYALILLRFPQFHFSGAAPPEPELWKTIFGTRYISHISQKQNLQSKGNNSDNNNTKKGSKIFLKKITEYIG